ncbi:MAG: DUF2188 domain-containing protein [Acholeplasmataceae bacterium]|nr:DUF2188 domain-containing protein [Acholeplasmataceae bacterium]
MCFFRKRKAREKAEHEARPAAMNQEEKVVEEKPQVETKPEEVKKEPSSKPTKYHVSQNKDAKSEGYKKWRVRKEGSNKTIKYFDTQKDAIAFAETLAGTSGSSVVIHKLDGSIRKQDYGKKE